MVFTIANNNNLLAILASVYSDCTSGNERFVRQRNGLVLQVQVRKDGQRYDNGLETCVTKPHTQTAQRQTRALHTQKTLDEVFMTAIKALMMGL
jgi:hypothetical protein